MEGLPGGGAAAANNSSDFVSASGMLGQWKKCPLNYVNRDGRSASFTSKPWRNPSLTNTVFLSAPQANFYDQDAGGSDICASGAVGG